MVQAAHAISSFGADLVRQVNQRLDAYARNDAYAAGAFTGQEDQARAHLAQGEDLLREGRMELRKLISDDGAPEVKALAKRLDAHEAYLQKVRGALEAAGKSGAQEEERYRGFISEHAGHTRYRKVQTFLELAGSPDSAAHASDRPEDLREALEILSAVHAGCTGKYAGVRNVGPFTRDPDKNAELWCKAAAEREVLARRAVNNLALFTLGLVIRQIDQMRGDLERQEGYLRIDETMLRQALWDRQALSKDLSTRYAGIFAAAGIEGGPDLAPLDGAIAALFTEIERLAPRWTFPSGGRDGSEALARKQVRASVAGAEVKKTVMTDTQWKIVKNALGVPLHRTKDGAVLYKVRGEKLCRQQAFTYSETFEGRGYQKSDEVTLNYVRYLSCP